MKVAIRYCRFKDLQQQNIAYAFIVLKKNLKPLIYLEEYGSVSILCVTILPNEATKFGTWLQSRTCIVYNELEFRRAAKALTGMKITSAIDTSAYEDYQWPKVCYSYDNYSGLNSLASSVVNLYQLHCRTAGSAKSYERANSVLVNICYNLRVPYLVYEFVRSMLLHVIKPPSSRGKL